MKPRSASPVGSKSPPTVSAQITAYLAAQPPKVRAGLKTLSKLIRSAAPEAEPAFSYGMPAFRFEGRMLTYFAAFKDHSSLFPGASALRVLAPELKDYKISKGTLQFPHGAPPPADLVARLLQVRIEEIRAAASKTKRTPRPGKKS